MDGASALARQFHLPELLIGATVVSVGTTLPEVMVSTISAVSGHGEIAYGNAIGSVICNAALIAAITVAVRPGKVDPKTLRVPVAFFFAAAAIYCVAAYGMGRFTRPMGLLMLGMFVAYMAANVWQMKNAPAEPEHEEEPMGIGKIVLLLVVGAALIALGANLLVDNGTIIAQAMGVPESVIALTFVALGTSLPELVTAITSLMKGHSDLSLGNVVGANVFNLVLVSGMSVTLAPFEIPQSATLFGINSSLVLELPVLLLVMVLRMIPSFIRKAGQIMGARKSVGLGAGENSTMKEKLTSGMRTLSALTDWALEGSIVTGDSMRARGYGTAKRTSFQIYRMKALDWTLLAVMLTLAGVAAVAAAMGGAAAEFTPKLAIQPVTGIYAPGFIAYCAYLFIPSALHMKEAVQWHISRSRI